MGVEVTSSVGCDTADTEEVTAELDLLVERAVLDPALAELGRVVWEEVSDDDDVVDVSDGDG